MVLAEDIDIAVVGTGPAGLAAALALAHVGARVALIGPAPRPPAPRPRPLDTRTAALLDKLGRSAEGVGVWDALCPHAAPLKAIRIIDASRSLLRAPDIEFKASELGLEAFGYNIANTVLVEALYARAQDAVACGHPGERHARSSSTASKASG